MNNGRISLIGLQFYAHHGYYAEEQHLGGQYVVDLHLNLDVGKASRTDALEDTVNYERVFKLVQQEMEQPSRLIEHIAGRILNRIGEEFSIVEQATILVKKVSPPIQGSVEMVQVELSQTYSR